MIISSANDYREAAKRRLPPFLFHYIDGGAYAEQTLKKKCRRPFTDCLAPTCFK